MYKIMQVFCLIHTKQTTFMWWCFYRFMHHMLGQCFDVSEQRFACILKRLILDQAYAEIFGKKGMCWLFWEVKFNLYIGRPAHLQDQQWANSSGYGSDPLHSPYGPESFTLKMEAILPSETTVHSLTTRTRSTMRTWKIIKNIVLSVVSLCVLKRCSFVVTDVSE